MIDRPKRWRLTLVPVGRPGVRFTRVVTAPCRHAHPERWLAIRMKDLLRWQRLRCVAHEEIDPTPPKEDNADV